MTHLNTQDTQKTHLIGEKSSSCSHAKKRKKKVPHEKEKEMTMIKKKKKGWQTHQTAMKTTHATQVHGPRRAFTSACEVRRESPPTAVREAM